MKIKVILALLCLTSCTKSNVQLANESLPKTVMIIVTSDVNDKDVNKSTEDYNIEVSGRTATILGSGVFVSPTGHVLTCAHLLSVGSVRDVMVMDYYGNVYKADVIYKEDRLDLLLLKVETSSNAYAELADPRSLTIGQSVMAIGYPLGMEFSVSHGIISHLNRDVGVYNMVQSDCFINPGNSGGPMFNTDGELVGINSRVLSPIKAGVFTGLGFSVSCGQILEFLVRFRGLEKVRTYSFR